ncbi:hypothetical protein ABK040_000224 [Willaertia magna]
MNKFKVLLSNPLVHTSLSPFEKYFDFTIFSQTTNATTTINTFESFLNKVNELKPNAILFVGWKSSFKLTRNEFFEKLNKETLQNLKIIANHGVGYDSIDVKGLLNMNINDSVEMKNKKPSIIITNTPDVVSDATADITMTLILNTSRFVRVFENNLRNLQWKNNLENTLFGNDLRNKTLGIIGLGSIGQQVAIRALSFGMRVVYFQRNQNLKFEKDLNEMYDNYLSKFNLFKRMNDKNIIEYCKDLNPLLNQSDFVSIHVPLTEETKHLIKKEQFKEMKSNAIIINTSRGAVIKESDLLEALQNGVIKGCGLDVFEFEPNITKELLELNEKVPCCLLPHIGTQTSDSRKEMEELCLRNIESVLVKEEGPITPVPEMKAFF